MKDSYVNPLCERYSSKEMKYIFSPDNKFSTWRKLWVALAESEKELGLDIKDEQIREMKENIYNIDYDKAREHESRVRHDVMAHVLTFGELCPDGAGMAAAGSGIFSNPVPQYLQALPGESQIPAALAADPGSGAPVLRLPQVSPAGAGTPR